MRLFLIILAILALALTIVPPFLHWGGLMDLPMVKKLMFGSLVLWFAAILPLQKYSVRR